MVSEQQLATWANTGADVAAKNSCDRVKNIIESSSFSKKSVAEIFLQGSYANFTHIRADSDVDIVIKLNNVWDSDIRRLSQTDLQQYRSSTSQASYSHMDLRRELISIFRNAIGADKVEERKKCIRLKLGAPYLNVDLIPACSYRVYLSFSSTNQTNYIEGISVMKTDGNMFYNFPKQHRENGTTKHQSTGEQYKKVVRIFKNMRNRLIDQGKIQSDLAPSYFLECLVYNIPNQSFERTLNKSAYNALVWLKDNCQKSSLLCQNGLTSLFGQADTQWNPEKSQLLISRIIDFWNSHYQNA